jgi:hypothetical protein
MTFVRYQFGKAKMSGKQTQGSATKSGRILLELRKGQVHFRRDAQLKRSTTGGKEYWRLHIGSEESIDDQVMTEDLDY